MSSSTCTHQTKAFLAGFAVLHGVFGSSRVGSDLDNKSHHQKHCENNGGQIGFNMINATGIGTSSQNSQFLLQGGPKDCQNKCQTNGDCKNWVFSFVPGLAFNCFLKATIATTHTGDQMLCAGKPEQGKEKENADLEPVNKTDKQPNDESKTAGAKTQPDLEPVNTTDNQPNDESKTAGAKKQTDPEPGSGAPYEPDFKMISSEKELRDLMPTFCNNSPDHLADYLLVLRIYGDFKDWKFSSSIQDMSYLFPGSSATALGRCPNLISKLKEVNLENWDVQHVTNMEGMFKGIAFLGNGLDKWHVKQVTNMSSMFEDSGSFDQNLSSWDVRSVTNMRMMFKGTKDFTGKGLDHWGDKLSKVTDMSSMFQDSGFFDQNLSSWDVRSVTTMNSMFKGAGKFHGKGLDVWGDKLSKVTDMSSMFQDSGFFDQDLKDWDVSSVTTMNSMFKGAGMFQGKGLDVWDDKLSKVTDMNSMFQDSGSLRSLGKGWKDWDVRSVTKMNSMFKGARQFQGTGIGFWEVRNVEDMSSMFEDCADLKDPYFQWNVRSVTNMKYMFKWATKFQGTSLHQWGGLNQLSKVTDMTSMFEGCRDLKDPDLTDWDVSSVTNMNSMFKGATQFQGTGLDHWGDKLSKVTDMSSMFEGCSGLNRTQWGFISQQDSKWFHNPSDLKNTAALKNMFEKSSTFGVELFKQLKNPKNPKP